MKYNKAVKRKFTREDILEIEAGLRSEAKRVGATLRSFKTYKQEVLPQAYFPLGKFLQFQILDNDAEHILQQFYGVYRVWREVESHEIHTR